VPLWTPLSVVIPFTVWRVAFPEVSDHETSIQLTHNTKRLNDKNILQVGEIAQISAGFTPNNATIQKVSWSLTSGNATLHTVKAGSRSTDQLVATAPKLVNVIGVIWAPK
jgi:hypothetical protein